MSPLFRRLIRPCIRTTVIWNLLEFNCHSGFPFETLHNLDKGMVEWLMSFLGIQGSDQGSYMPPNTFLLQSPTSISFLVMLWLL